MGPHIRGNKAAIWTTLFLSACAGDVDSDRASAHESQASESKRAERDVAEEHEESAGDADSADATREEERASDEASEQEGDAQSRTDNDQPELDVRTPLKDLPDECRGFEVAGLTESPGGSVLPNTCAPFHGTYNNPYAIRCVDADPDYKSGYPGDEYCILPPPEDLGTQVHVGPDDYASPGTFELASGDEENTMYWVNAHNTEDHYYYRANWRMRAGSHHMIINISDTDHADGWAADLMGDDARNVGVAGFDTSGGSRSFGGSQRPDLDRPQGVLDVPPENVGIGALLKAKQQFAFNLHHLNTTQAPVLREAWVNIWYMDKDDVTKEMRPLAASGSPRDVAIPPRQRTILKYRCDVPADARIITMNGHRHAHTDRFSVWLKKRSGEEIRAYESFDWEDMPTYQYDSISTNPMADVDQHLDGASSGVLAVSEGDELYFLCDINNTLDTPLKFANEAIDGEMCILFGTYIGETSPCGDGAQRIEVEQ